MSDSEYDYSLDGLVKDIESTVTKAREVCMKLILLCEEIHETSVQEEDGQHVEKASS